MAIAWHTEWPLGDDFEYPGTKVELEMDLDIPEGEPMLVYRSRLTNTSPYTLFVNVYDPQTGALVLRREVAAGSQPDEYTFQQNRRPNYHNFSIAAGLDWPLRNTRD